MAAPIHSSFISVILPTAHCCQLTLLLRSCSHLSTKPGTWCVSLSGQERMLFTLSYLPFVPFCVSVYYRARSPERQRAREPRKQPISPLNRIFARGAQHAMCYSVWYTL